MSIARKCTAYGATTLAAGLALSGCLPQGQTMQGQQQAPRPATVTKVVEAPEPAGTGSESEESQATDTSGTEPTEVERTTEQPGTEPTGSEVIEDDEGVINPCTDDALTGSLRSTEYEAEGEGHGYVTVTNNGSETCYLEGYPRLRMSQRGDVDLPTSVSGQLAPAPTMVEIAPGERAGFVVQWWTVAYHGSDEGCVTPNYLNITPPSNAGFVAVSANRSSESQLHPCHNGTLYVSGWSKTDR